MSIPTKASSSKAKMMTQLTARFGIKSMWMRKSAILSQMSSATPLPVHQIHPSSYFCFRTLLLLQPGTYVTEVIMIQSCSCTSKLCFDGKSFEFQYWHWNIHFDWEKAVSCRENVDKILGFCLEIVQQSKELGQLLNFTCHILLQYSAFAAYVFMKVFYDDLEWNFTY